MNRRVFVTMVREYKTTAFTPAFFFAVVLFPAIIIGGIFIIGTTGLLRSERAALEGVIGVADLTENGIVAEALQSQFDPVRRRAEQEARAAEVQRVLEEKMPPGMADSTQTQMAMTMLAGRETNIAIAPIDAEADLEATKARLFSEEDDGLLAFVLVGKPTLEVRVGDQGDVPAAAEADAPQTVTAAADRLGRGRYEVYTSRGFDPQARRDMERYIDDAIVDERMRVAGLDPELVSTLRQRPISATTTVTADAETASIDEMQMFIPMAFMMLLWISVMTGGQYLLMSTIEEKSSRVMEVLLSAISPTELLTGKIIGQGLVALTVLAVYVGIGMVGLNQLGPQLFSLLPMDILPWLVVYFVIAFGLFACLMAAVGSAVSDIREAQSLLGPIMLLLMFPLFLWFFIVDSPNSVFAVVLSYIPITTPFVMILRIAQTTDPVPLWQMISTSFVGFAGVLVIGWAAVKIFRIGVLMYGKPPSFMDLLKWLRYG